MSIEAPKKERKFIKAIGKIGKVLAEQLVLGIGRKFIGKVVDKVRIGKRQQMTILLALFTTLTFASIDSIPYPITGNKQRLGFNTTGNGLVWRGLVSDTVTKPTNYADKNIKAYLVLDSVTGSLYIWKQGLWAAFSGSAFTQPLDSLFFDTSVSPNNVDTAKMRWDYDLATVVLGMYDQVPNELGFKNFWLVKNQTGSTIAKGSVVYASGTVGASGRIDVSKFIADGTIEPKLVLGVTAHDLSNGEDGYVIDFGKIRKVNTDTFAAGAILYPSPTTAGAFTDVEPQAPNITMPIAFCINSSSNNGTIAIRVASGYKMHEIQDVDTTGISTNEGLVYNGSYFVASNGALITANDTASMLSNYATKAYADTSGRFYARQDFTNATSATLDDWTQSDTLIAGNSSVLQVYRNGQILLPSQYTVVDTNTITIASASFKSGDNYTVIFPRGGGAESGGGSGSLTSISGGTGITVSPDPITTTGTVSADTSFLFTQSDTLSLNLTNRFAAKQNTLTLTTTGTSGASTLVGSTLNIPQYSGGGGSGTVTSVATGYGLSGGTITTSGTLLLDSATVFTRIRDSIVNVAIGNDSIKILKQEYPGQTSAILNWTVTSKFPIQLKAFILVFRNGQLLNNNQYDITDTAQITIVSSSFKSGGNYTVATVSGIGSVSSGQGNPVYPEAGIALSTGTTWTTSITNNSSNWNTAYTDRLKWDGGSTGLTAATGRTSLGGTTIGQNMFTLTNPSAIRFPRFNADNTIDALSAADFRSAIGTGTVTSVTAAGTSGNPISITNTTTTPTIDLPVATSSQNGYLSSADWTTFNNKQSQLNGTGFVKASGTSISYDNSTYLTTSSAASTYQTILTNPVTGTGTSGYLPKFTGASAIGNSVIQESSGNIGIGISPTANLELAKGKYIMLNSRDGASQDSAGIMLYETGTKTSNDINFGAKIMYNADSDNFEIKMKNYNGTTLFNPPVSITIPRTSGDVNIGTALNVTGAATLSSTLAVTGETTLSNLSGSGTRMVTASSTGVLSTQTIPGGGGGSGTVTSVAMTVPSFLSVSGSPITSSGTLAVSLSGNALPLANGGTGATDAANARITLGGTTSGISLFTLTNSVSDKFIKVNSNNTITLLNADDTRTAIGAGTGSVSSVAMTVPSFLSVSGSPITSSGTLAVSLSGVPLPVLNGGTGGANEADARNNLGAACKSCTETLTGNKTFSGTVTLSSVSGTATSVIGRSSTGQVVGVTLGSGLTLSSGTLSASTGNYTRYTTTTITVPATDKYVDIHNSGTVTLTLPNAADYTGKEIVVKNSITTLVRSATQNIITFALGTTPATTTILSGSTEAKFAVLVSDGTYWRIMQAN